mmetsp:Transcript_13846/g.22871  ORF Transcript_13846/g.22871 Transcript_13846/m.22871 type:complete len:350 (-) Transcript_13846:353-1402(-)
MEEVAASALQKVIKRNAVVSVNAEDDDKLAEEERSFLLFALQKPDRALIVIDPNTEFGSVVYASDGFQTLSGYSLVEVVGKSCRTLWQGPETDEEDLEEIENAISKRKQCRVRFRGCKKSGASALILAHLTPLDGPIKNQNTYFMALFVNLDDHSSRPPLGPDARISSSRPTSFSDLPTHRTLSRTPSFVSNSKKAILSKSPSTTSSSSSSSSRLSTAHDIRVVGQLVSLENTTVLLPNQPSPNTDSMKSRAHLLLSGSSNSGSGSSSSDSAHSSSLRSSSSSSRLNRSNLVNLQTKAQRLPRQRSSKVLFETNDGEPNKLIVSFDDMLVLKETEPTISTLKENKTHIA